MLVHVHRDLDFKSIFYENIVNYISESAWFARQQPMQSEWSISILRWGKQIACDFFLNRVSWWFRDGIRTTNIVPLKIISTQMHLILRQRPWRVWSEPSKDEQNGRREWSIFFPQQRSHWWVWDAEHRHWETDFKVKSYASTKIS